MDLCVVGGAVDLRWAAANGGDDAFYEAEVKEVTATAVVFTYAQTSDWNAFDESILHEHVGARVRELQKRRSKRPKKALQFSYSDLESGLVMRRKDSAEFAEMLLSEGHFEPDTVPRIDGTTLTAELLRESGFREPLIARTVDQIDGMRMPKELTVEKIAELVGEDVVMPVLDVGPQAEVSMSLKSWVEYFRDPGRSRKLNVTSLEITGTELAKLTQTPSAVRQLDWIDVMWPTQLKEIGMARLIGATSKFGVGDSTADGQADTAEGSGESADSCPLAAVVAEGSAAAGREAGGDGSSESDESPDDSAAEAGAAAEAVGGAKRGAESDPAGSDDDGGGDSGGGSDSPRAKRLKTSDQTPLATPTEPPVGDEDAAEGDEEADDAPDLGASIIYFGAKRRGVAAHAERMESKAATRRQNRQRQQRTAEGAVAARQQQQLEGMLKRDAAAQKALSTLQAEKRQKTAPKLRCGELDKLAEYGGKPPPFWSGSKTPKSKGKASAVPPLPLPRELRRWNRASQEAYYFARLAFWKRQGLNICLQSCAKKDIYAGGDVIHLRDRLARWDFGGKATLQEHELVPPALPPPQPAARLFQQCPASGEQCELWHEGAFYQCRVVEKEEEPALRIKIHYDEWEDDQYDEWLPWPAGGARLRTATPPAPPTPPAPKVVAPGDRRRIAREKIAQIYIESGRVPKPPTIEEAAPAASAAAEATSATPVAPDAGSPAPAAGTASPVAPDEAAAKKTAAKAPAPAGAGAAQEDTAEVPVAATSSPPPSAADAGAPEAVATNTAEAPGAAAPEATAAPEAAAPKATAPDAVAPEAASQETAAVAAGAADTAVTVVAPGDRRRIARERIAQLYIESGRVPKPPTIEEAAAVAEEESDNEDSMAAEDWAKCQSGEHAVEAQVSAVLGLMVRAVADESERQAAERRAAARAASKARRSVPRISQRRRNVGIVYPKVQVYVLMGTAGSYTDFHIDFGGTSVWYHIVEGEKLFYVLPPTKANLRKFEDWSCSAAQSALFFPDVAPGPCMRVHLKAGDTFLIPPGWIHGVYTPVDSVVFGVRAETPERSCARLSLTRCFGCRGTSCTRSTSGCSSRSTSSRTAWACRSGSSSPSSRRCTGTSRSTTWRAGARRTRGGWRGRRRGSR